MAQLILNYPDEYNDRILEAVCVGYGYRPFVEGPDNNEIPNPVSREEFVKMRIVHWVKKQVVAHEDRVSRIEASNAIEAEIDSIDFS